MGDEPKSNKKFIGRGETVGALYRQAEEAQSGQGHVSLLVGARGVGKSTLVNEFALRAREKGVRVLVGRAPPFDEPPPFAPIQSAVESDRDNPKLSLKEPTPGDTPPPIFPLELLSESGRAQEPTPFENQLPRVLGITNELRQATQASAIDRITDWFLELARRGPVDLILEDLHRADEPTLGVVEALANRPDNRNLWILATIPPYDSLADAKGTRLQAFARATQAREIVLRPMNLQEVTAFLRTVEPGKTFPHEEVLRLHGETGGNPLLLEQHLRHPGTSTQARSPEGATLSPLDQDAARVLGVAAVLGAEFRLDLLQGTSGLSKARLGEVVDYLVRKGLLFERTDEVIDFPQERLRAQVYGHLSEGQLQLIHRRAGQTRESLGTSSASRIFSLARDFYIARDDQKSLKYNRIAAEIAEQALAPDVARTFLARALENQRRADPADRDAEAKQLLELARLTYDVGRLEEAESMLRGFLDRSGGDTTLAPRLRATVEILLAQVRTAKGDLPGAMKLAEGVLVAPGIEADPLIRIGAHHQLGIVYYYEGRYAEALDQHTKEFRLAEETRDIRAIANARKWVAASLGMMGKSELALQEARESAAALDRLGSVGESAQAHLFLGNMLADDKSTPLHRQEAFSELGKAIRFGEQAHDPRRVGWALYYTSELLLEEKRLDEAAEKARQAYHALGRIGDRVGQSVATKVLGQVAMAQGAYERSESDLREAQRLLEGSDHKLEEIDVALRLAELHAVRGESRRAREELTELERRGLRKARPDLVALLDQLKNSLATEAPGPP